MRVSDRFRDLELSGRAGRKDAVLLATVSSFEAIAKPSRRDLKQFADLFVPLFDTVSDEARRTAAASLSRAGTVPPAVSRLILDQPIDVAAPYLVHSVSLDDQAIISAIDRHGLGHARAAARRKSVSRALRAALAAFSDPIIERALSLRAGTSRQEPAAAIPSEDARRFREDDIRNKLRSMVMRNRPEIAPPPALPARIAPDVEARLIRHVADGDTVYFATALADALASRFELAERIMMDVSGAQLAQTLVALGLRYTTIVAALERFFPHLAEGDKADRPSLTLLRSCSFVECVDRVTAWQRADWSARRAVNHEPAVADRSRRGAAGEAQPVPDRQAARPLRRA